MGEDDQCDVVGDRVAGLGDGAPGGLGQEAPVIPDVQGLSRPLSHGRRPRQ